MVFVFSIPVPLFLRYESSSSASACEGYPYACTQSELRLALQPKGKETMPVSGATVDDSGVVSRHGGGPRAMVWRGVGLTLKSRVGRFQGCSAWLSRANKQFRALQ